jgi:hypothetical protein
MSTTTTMMRTRNDDDRDPYANSAPVPTAASSCSQGGPPVLQTTTEGKDGKGGESLTKWAQITIDVDSTVRLSDVENHPVFQPLRLRN